MSEVEWLEAIYTLQIHFQLFLLVAIGLLTGWIISGR
jgi:hypothetical protein